MARSKFNVDDDKLKRSHNGIVFDSILEMKFYRDVLCPLVESGRITTCELQKPYELQPGFERGDKKVKAVTYVADFYIVLDDGKEYLIDTKGCPDSVAILKRKMFWYRYPEVDYYWVCYSKIDGGWCDYEFVKKQRYARKKAKKLVEKEKEKMEEINNGEN